MTNHPNRSGQRYDLAFFGDLLIACVPHGDDIEAAVRKECSRATIDYQEPRIIEGVYLINDPPRDGDEVVHSGGKLGWPIDINGNFCNYAVKR